MGRILEISFELKEKGKIRRSNTGLYQILRYQNGLLVMRLIIHRNLSKNDHLTYKIILEKYLLQMTWMIFCRFRSIMIKKV